MAQTRLKLDVADRAMIAKIVRDICKKWINNEQKLMPYEPSGTGNDAKPGWLVISGGLIESLDMTMARAFATTASYTRLRCAYQLTLYYVPPGFFSEFEKKLVAAHPEKGARKHVKRLLKSYPELVLTPMLADIYTKSLVEKN